MRSVWPLCLFLLLLAGCAAEVRTSPEVQLRLSPQASRNITPAELGIPSPTLYPQAPSAGSFTPADAAVGNPAAAGVAAEDQETDDAAIAAVVDGDDEETLDPETLEDTAALQAADAAPPEEEGETVFIDEKTFDFPVVDNEKVRYFVDYFSGPIQKHVRNWLERSTAYLPMMQEIFAEQGLPRDLVYLAMIESGFNNKAYSRARASGPWQFIEGTGRVYGLSNDWWRDERRDPEKAPRAAARHLSDLYRMFDGDWYLALAAYNAGAGKIKKAIERYGTRDFWQLTHGSYLRKETKEYVPKMLAGLMIAKHPEYYGFTELNYQEPLAYEQVEIPSVTDVEVIARLTESDYETIKKLNPELKRWSTPPGAESYQVRLPVGSGVLFAERYAQLPENQRANFVYYKVKKGDTPNVLARRYNVRSDDILRFNNLRSSKSLRVGQNLLIPLNPEAGKMSLAELRESLRDDAPAAKSGKGGTKSYTVRSGDSLWKIAKRFNVSEKQLRSWNGLGGKNSLKVGQALVVAAASGKGKPAAVARNTSPAAPKAAKADLKKIVYQVRSGDSLWTISRQFDVDAHQIRNWNKLSKNTILRPGQRLTLLVKSTPRG
ncbi:MAG: LysM peptidoglycan-binding domain-containing protein [Desulfuromonas sp.]|nr:LysM peptidoglycan-binding domain-containing protein [Desulfuromonas sp.]